MAGAHVAPARHCEHCIGGMRTQLTLWSNAGVFVRVWEYEVPGDRAEAFLRLLQTIKSPGGT